MGIFSYDNIVFTVINKIVDIIFASILWVVFCIPIVTIGASSTALYYTAHKSLRRGQGYVFRSFWGAFKSNFFQTTKIWLITAVLGVILFLDQRICGQFSDVKPIFSTLRYVIFTLMALLAVWAVYVFSYSARFALGMKGTMKNALLIAIANLPWSVLALLICAAGCLIVYLIPVSLLVLPALLACLLDLILERIFRKYMSKEDQCISDSHPL